jgi:hypothetical protein
VSWVIGTISPIITYILHARRDTTRLCIVAGLSSVVRLVVAHRQDTSGHLHTRTYGAGGSESWDAASEAPRQWSRLLFAHVTTMERGAAFLTAAVYVAMPFAFVVHEPEHSGMFEIQFLREIAQVGFLCAVCRMSRRDIDFNRFCVSNNFSTLVTIFACSVVTWFSSEVVLLAILGTQLAAEPFLDSCDPPCISLGKRFGKPGGGTKGDSSSELLAASMLSRPQHRRSTARAQFARRPGPGTGAVSISGRPMVLHVQCMDGERIDVTVGARQTIRGVKLLLVATTQPDLDPQLFSLFVGGSEHELRDTDTVETVGSGLTDGDALFLLREPSATAETDSRHLSAVFHAWSGNDAGACTERVQHIKQRLLTTEHRSSLPGSLAGRIATLQQPSGFGRSRQRSGRFLCLRVYGDVLLHPALFRLTALVELDLSRIGPVESMSGSGMRIPDEIGRLVALVTLNLAHNKLTGRIPSTLGNLVELYSLDLSNNELIGSVPEELYGLANLQRTSLDGNRLSGVKALLKHQKRRELARAEG